MTETDPPIHFGDAQPGDPDTALRPKGLTLKKNAS